MVEIVCNAFCGVMSGCSLLPVICDSSLGRFASDTGGPGALLFPCCCVGELSFPGVCDVVDGGCDVNRGNAKEHKIVTVQIYIKINIPKEISQQRAHQWPREQGPVAVDHERRMSRVPT